MKKYALPLILTSLLTACGGNTSNTPQATRPQPPPAITYQSPPIIFKGLRNDYSITRSATGFKVSNKSGVSTELASTAQIQFDDMRINLQIGDKAQSIAPVDLRALIDLYIAFFNRVPDADGLEYWIEQFKAGMSIDQISQNFYAAALLYSAQTGYDAKMTDEDFVRIVYKNVLGRSGAKAPPDADVNYWANELKNGRSKGNLISTMLVSARSFTGDAEWGWVPTLLDNKVAVGTYFAVQQGINYNTPEESISKTIAIVAAITPTTTVTAKSLIGVNDTQFNLRIPAIAYHAVSTNAGEGTSFNLASASVESGKSATFNVTLLAGYKDLSVSGCGVSLSQASSGVYPVQTSAVTAPCTVSAAATKVTATASYKVSLASTNGAVYDEKGAGLLSGKELEFKKGESIVITLAANSGYSAGFDDPSRQAVLGGTCKGAIEFLTSMSARLTPTSDCSLSVAFAPLDSNRNRKPDSEETEYMLQTVDVQPRVIRESELLAGGKSMTISARITGSVGPRFDGTKATVARMMGRSRLKGEGTAVWNGIAEEFELFDDGTHGDAVAGDKLYTRTMIVNGIRSTSGASMLKDRAYDIYVDHFAVDASGETILPTNNILGHGGNAVILKDSVAHVAMTQVNGNTFAASRFVNIVVPSAALAEDIVWVSQRTGSVIDGSYDHATQFNFAESYNTNWTYFVSAKNNASGIGIGNTWDDSAKYGLPGICGVSIVGLRHLNGTANLHEWGGTVLVCI